MIDRKCKVTLGGLPQKIHVKGDETKPVLLFLHGEAYLVEGIAHSGSVKG